MVIGNYTIQSGTYDFLLTFHSNHRPISHRFRDKRRFPLKIVNFNFGPVYLNAPAEGVPLGNRYRHIMMGLPDAVQHRQLRQYNHFVSVALLCPPCLAISQSGGACALRA